MFGQREQTAEETTLADEIKKQKGDHHSWGGIRIERKGGGHCNGLIGHCNDVGSPLGKMQSH